jgi:hypothetical protein
LPVDAALVAGQHPRVLLIGPCTWLRVGHAVIAGVNANDHKVRIRCAAVRTKGGYIITSPKSDAGLRDVSIPPHVLPLIETHLTKYVDSGRDSWLLPADSGGCLPPSTSYRHWLSELMSRRGHSTSGAAMRYQHTVAGRDREVAVLLSRLADTP